jgi:tetratricopeptide (TPR) repeat protein
MMTTKKRRRFHYNLVVVAAVGMLLTACGPPGARQLQQGERYIEAGQFSEAIVVLRDATRILGDAPRPVQAKAWNLLGLAYHNSGQLEAADNAYRAALKLDRDNAAIDYNLGCLRILQSNFPGAIDNLTTYVALRPKDVQGYLRLATAHFHYALERTGTDRNRFLEAARHDLEMADSLSPSADAANILGVIHMQRRAPGAETVRAAAVNFELALRRDPHCAPALLNMAIMSQQYLNNPAQALKLYRQYLTLTPAPPHAKEVANLAHDLDVSQRIIITPETAPGPAHAPAPRPAPPSARLNVAPSNPVAATSTKPLPPSSPPAEASISTPAPSPPPSSAPSPPPQPPPRVSAPVSVVQAPPETSSTVNSTPSIPEPVVTETAPPPRTPLTQRLNPLHWFSGKPKTNEYASANVDPPPVPVGTRYEYPLFVTPIPGDRARAKRLQSKANRARQGRDLNQSILDYQEAITADPTFYEATLQLGLTAIENRDYEIALEALHRALTLQEDSAEARYAFAWTLQKRGYTEDAVHELDKLLGQHPEDVRAHLLLGNLYSEKLHQPKLAREQYTQALELDPANAQAANIRAWLQQKQ